MERRRQGEVTTRGGGYTERGLHREGTTPGEATWEGTARGGDYTGRRLHTERRLHRKVITQGRDYMGRGRTRRAEYTERGLHGEGTIWERYTRGGDFTGKGLHDEEIILE